jgi:peptidoglycan hydrolase-like protein with peptidoglycan-binding domain
MLTETMFPYRQFGYLGSHKPSGDKPVFPKFPLQPDKNKRAVLQRLGDRLTSYGEVTALQTAILALLSWGQTKGLPRNVAPNFSSEKRDGKYGPATHEGVRRLAKLGVLVGAGNCGGGFHLSDIDSVGPNAVRGCLEGPWPDAFVGGEVVTPPANFITASIMDIAQQAWTEWRAALREPSPPPDATTPVAETTPEPTEDEIVGVQEGTGLLPHEKKDEGMSTATWIALFVGGALLAGGIYYVADSK